MVITGTIYTENLSNADQADLMKIAQKMIELIEKDYPLAIIDIDVIEHVSGGSTKIYDLEKGYEEDLSDHYWEMALEELDKEEDQDGDGMEWHKMECLHAWTPHFNYNTQSTTTLILICTKCGKRETRTNPKLPGNWWTRVCERMEELADQDGDGVSDKDGFSLDDLMKSIISNFLNEEEIDTLKIERAEKMLLSKPSNMIQCFDFLKDQDGDGMIMEEQEEDEEQEEEEEDWDDYVDPTEALERIFDKVFYSNDECVLSYEYSNPRELAKILEERDGDGNYRYNKELLDEVIEIYNPMSCCIYFRSSEDVYSDGRFNSDDRMAVFKAMSVYPQSDLEGLHYDQELWCIAQYDSFMVVESYTALAGIFQEVGKHPNRVVEAVHEFLRLEGFEEGATTYVDFFGDNVDWTVGRDYFIVNSVHSNRELIPVDEIEDEEYSVDGNGQGSTETFTWNDEVYEKSISFWQGSPDYTLALKSDLDDHYEEMTY